MTVAVNWRLAPPEIAYIVADAGAKVFARRGEFVPIVDATISTPGSRSWWSTAGRRSPATPMAGATHQADDPMVPQAQDDICYQLYSSGTTGRPKGVQLTQANLFSGLDLYPDLLDFGSDSVNLVAMPLFHIGGGGWALAGLAVGATNVIVRELDPADLVDIIDRERITHAFLVPVVLQFMVAVPGVEDRDFSALGTFLYGASPISEQVLADSMRGFGCDFMQAYGLTETTGSVVLLPADDHDPDGPNRHRLRAAGLPTPTARSASSTRRPGEDVPVGEVGEIWIRAPP